MRFDPAQHLRCPVAALGRPRYFVAPLLLAACTVSGSAQAQTSNSAQAIFREALRLQHSGQLAAAERTLERAHSLAPRDQSITTALGRLEAVLGRNDDAISLLREVVALNPNSSESQLNLAVALASAGSLEAALASATQAVNLDPKSTAAHHIRGKILADLNRNDEAQAEFNAALGLDPVDALTLYDDALLAEASGHLPDEVVLLERLNRVVPGRAPYHFLLGRALSRTGNLTAARQQFREAIRLDPNHRAALYSLSRSLQADSPAEAAQLAERFRSLSVSEEELNAIRSQGNQGIAAMGRKEWSGAITAFQTALSACAGCTLEATLEKDLGLAQCQAGDPVAGAGSLRRSLMLDPRDLEALQALELAEKASAAPH